MPPAGLTQADQATTVAAPDSAFAQSPQTPRSTESKVTHGYTNLIGVALPRIAGRHVIAPPGKCELKAVILIGHAKSASQRLEAIGRDRRVLVPAGQVEHAGTEQRPVTRECHPAGNAQFLAVLEVFDGRDNIAVEAQIADFGVSSLGTDCRVDFIPAERQIVLVQPEAVGEPDEILEANFCPPDDVRTLAG